MTLHPDPDPADHDCLAVGTVASSRGFSRTVLAAGGGAENLTPGRTRPTPNIAIPPGSVGRDGNVSELLTTLGGDVTCGARPTCGADVDARRATIPVAVRLDRGLASACLGKPVHVAH